MMLLPPIFVVPFMVIIAESRVFFARPCLASHDMTVPLKFNTLNGRIGLRRQIEMLYLPLPDHARSPSHSARFLPLLILLKVTESLTMSVVFVRFFLCARRGRSSGLNRDSSHRASAFLPRLGLASGSSTWWMPFGRFYLFRRLRHGMLGCLRVLRRIRTLITAIAAGCMSSMRCGVVGRLRVLLFLSVAQHSARERKTAN